MFSTRSSVTSCNNASAVLSFLFVWVALIFKRIQLCGAFPTHLESTLLCGSNVDGSSWFPITLRSRGPRRRGPQTCRCCAFWGGGAPGVGAVGCGSRRLKKGALVASKRHLRDFE